MRSSIPKIAMMRTLDLHDLCFGDFNFIFQYICFKTFSSTDYEDWTKEFIINMILLLRFLFGTLHGRMINFFVDSASYS